jgi:hypothetical protein
VWDQVSAPDADTGSMRRFAALALFCLVGTACPEDEEDAADLLLWEQVFGTFDCTANGRPAFAFEVIRKTTFGSDADWVDLGTQAKASATVSLTQLYLKGADDKPFRNFEYTVEVSEVLHHLTEWSNTTAGMAPYICFKR